VTSRVRRPSQDVMKDRESSLIIGLALTVGVGVGALVLFWVALAMDAWPSMESRIPSASMAPALLSGDYITSRRFISSREVFTLVHRGDIVVFRSTSDARQQFVKRVVGMPGDTIAMHDGVVQINGQVLREPYLAPMTDSLDPAPDELRWQKAYLVGAALRDSARYVASRNNWGPLLVPRGSYFVLGDTRDESLDSRYLGFVPATGIIARVRRVYFSRDDHEGIRWSRIGHLVK
jgi:signal peptidase I